MPFRQAHRVALRKLSLYWRLQKPVVCLEDECSDFIPVPSTQISPADHLFHRCNACLGLHDPQQPCRVLLKQAREGLPIRHCHACEEPADEDDLLYEHLYRATCLHDFCDACLARWSRAMLVDESVYPFRCCQPIPVQEILAYLEPGLAAAVSARKLELETSDRLYCAEPECSAFIPPSSVDDQFVVCGRCALRTCKLCKASDHGAADCPQDTELQGVLDLGQDEQWQRCYVCRTMVSLEIGCNHMT